MDFRRVMGMVPATCTYWKNASCFKGDRCTFFHGFICRDDGVCSDSACDKSHFKQKDPALTQASGIGQSYQRPQPPYLKNSASTPPVITSATTTTTIRRTETQNQTILIPHQVLQAQTRAHPAFKPSLPYQRSEKSKSKSKSRSRSRSRSRSYSPRRRRRSSSRSPSPRNDRDRGHSYRHKKSEKDSYYDSKDSSRKSKFKPIGGHDSYKADDVSSSRDRGSSYYRSSSSKSSYDSYDSKSHSKNSSRKRRSHSREK